MENQVQMSLSELNNDSYHTVQNSNNDSSANKLFESLAAWKQDEKSLKETAQDFVKFFKDRYMSKIAEINYEQKMSQYDNIYKNNDD